MKHEQTSFAHQPAADFAAQITTGGKIIKASVPLTDRGFRHGMHLFETVAIRNGVWMFYAHHIALLEHCAERAGFRCPSPARKTLRLLPLSGFLPADANGLLRIFWTAGEGAPSDPPSQGRLFLLWEPGALPVNQPMMRLCIWPQFSFSFAGLPLGWKTGNYWPNIHARRTAAEYGFDEILLVNPLKNVISAAFGNVFYRISGRWFTPPLKDGARAGCVRDWLLGCHFATEQSLHVDKLRSVDAWIITNSRIGPAVGLTAIANAPSGPLSSGIASVASELWRRWMMPETGRDI